MGLLDKYARKPQTEKRINSVGARLEPSLYKDFIELCERLGLTPSEAIRYLIVEEIAKGKIKNHIDDNERLTNVNEYKQMVTEVSASLPGGNLLLMEDNTTEKNNPGKAGSMKPWTIDDQVPCPVCKTWSSRSNFKRSHAAKHGYKNGYELIQAYKEKADEMVKERQS